VWARGAVYCGFYQTSEVIMRFGIILLGAMLSANVLACDLKVEAAWVREAPPNARALAAYGKLTNIGNAVLKIQSISSPAFAAVETHESLTEGGMAKMRPITVEIPAKGSVEFAAGGKHFMLMQPKLPLKKGDQVELHIKDGAGCVTKVQLQVGAPAAAVDHSTMDHSKMDHDQMNHEHMDHSGMKHE
jgi:periplasmic copper chaperone A